MSIFSRDTAAWGAKYISEQGGSVTIVNTFDFLQENTAIAASATSTIVLGPAASQLFLVDIRLGIRNNIQLALALTWTVLKISAPRIAYTNVGPDSIYLPGIFVEGQFDLVELAGVAGNFDLSITGYQFIYS